MNHIKLLDPNYAEFTDYLGVVKFTNGVSDEPVPNHLVNQMIAIGYAISYTDSDIQIGLYDLKHDTEHPALTPSIPTLAEIQESAEVVPEEAKTETPTSGSGYTLEQLEAIADSQGIKGLRDIADPLEVKGKSVEALIEGILNA
jgi:hypothetical protein